MLDNIDGPELQAVARRLKERWAGKRKFLLESSGNITESNLNFRAVNGTLVQDLPCTCDEGRVTDCLLQRSIY